MSARLRLLIAVFTAASTAAGLGCSSGGTDGSGATGGAGGAAPEGLIVYAKTPDPNGPPQVFSIAPDGTGETQLTQPSGSAWPQDANDGPVLSPDGTTILFGSGRDFPVQTGGVQNPTLRLIYTMALDGSGPTRVTANDPLHCSESGGRYSHDGAWIVFDMACDDDVLTMGLSKLYRIRTDGTGQERIAASDPISTAVTNVVDPVFAVGDAVVYAAVLGGGTSSDLYAVDLAQGTSTALTDHAAAQRYVIGPAMPTAAGPIYYMTQGDFVLADRAPRIERIAPDGTDNATAFAIDALMAPPSLAGAAQDGDFALGPDEAAFVFVSFADASAEPPTFVLATESLTGTGRRVIGSPGANVATPSWR